MSRATTVPERGDLILNPFDARCAYWNPFADVRSPADADRLAGFIVAKPGGGGAGDDVWYDQARIVVGAVIRRLWEGGRGTVPELTRALRDMTPDELSALTAGTEAARVFQKDADKATASVLFCLAEAAKVVGALRTEPGAGGSLSFDDFYAGLADTQGDKPWLFLASRKRNFAAARPLLGCWLDCAVAAILDRPIKGAPRAWLVLDELPALPRASGLLTLLPEGRKFGAAVVIAFQAIGQLRETYGPNAASTIVGQAGTQLVMRLGDPDSTGWAARLLGKAEVEEHRASQSLDTDEMHDKGSLSTMRQTRDVVLDSQIGELAPLTGYLRLSGLPVAKVKIGRKHMDRADVAEGMVAIVAASPPPPPQSSPLGFGAGDTAAGAARARTDTDTAAAQEAARGPDARRGAVGWSRRWVPCRAPGRRRATTRRTTIIRKAARPRARGSGRGRPPWGWRARWTAPPSPPACAGNSPKVSDWVRFAMGSATTGPVGT